MWKDGDALFRRCTLCRQPAENVAETVTQGQPCIVTSMTKQRSYDTPEGEKRTVIAVDVDDIDQSLRYATGAGHPRRQNHHRARHHRRPAF